MDKRTLDIEQPILITGCARSGTSMTAGIISICGAWGGQLAGSTKYNKRGMYENTQIRNSVIKPFLSSIGCDPMGQSLLPGPRHLSDIVNYSPQLKCEVLDIIKVQGYKKGTWFYKGAKMCLMWQAWHLAFPQARWIIVRRKDDDIVYSCLRTGFMRAYGDEQSWHQWVNRHKENFQQMVAAGLNIIEIWPQNMIRGNFSEIQQAIKDLGLKWKPKEIIDFISPALWSERNRYGVQGE